MIKSETINFKELIRTSKFDFTERIQSKLVDELEKEFNEDEKNGTLSICICT